MSRWRSIFAVVLVVMASAVSSATAKGRPLDIVALPRPVRVHGVAATAVPVASPPGSPQGTAPDPVLNAPLRPTATRGVAGQAALPAATSVLVKFKPGVPDATSGHALSSHSATTVGPVAGTGYTKVRPSGDPAALVTALRGDPSVEAVTLDYPRGLAAVPNDPNWCCAADPQSQYLTTVRMPEAWDRIRDASSQLVAVIDTGVDATNSDLVGHTVAGFNVVSPGNPPTDTDGHGTMVAGIIAANTNNGLGVTGVTWNGQVMPIKVFLDGAAGAFDSDIAVGIRYAADHGAKVINLSLGGPGDSPVLHDAIAYATSRDVVVVVASGNTSDNVPQFPAAYPEVLAVGATDATGALTDFSSWGDWLDVAAPGFHIVSTFLNNRYAVGDGTSFAAPIVSGIAALVRAASPSLSAAQVGDRLRQLGPRRRTRAESTRTTAGVWSTPRTPSTAALDSRAVLTAGPNEPNDVPARATDLANLTASGTISVEGDTDWYRYQETQNQSVTIAVTPAGFDGRVRNLDPVLEVYDANLGRIDAVDDVGPGQSESVAIATTPGTYYLKVHNFNGAADTRPYTVSVEPSPPTLFAPPRLIPMKAAAPSLAIGDVTGDGRNDVVFGTNTDGGPVPDNWLKLFVAVQQPNGSLAAPVRYDPTQASDMSSFVLLDVDRDGRRDVVIAGSNGLEWFRQTAAGVLVSQGLIAGVSGSVSSVIANDIDGDGVDDLAFLQAAGIMVLTHGAGSSFSLSTVSADTASVLRAGDLDGDGRTDLATVTLAMGRRTFLVYHNTTSGWTRTDHTATLPSLFRGIEVADVTGDGRADVITTANLNSPGVVEVFKQNTDGTLAPEVAYSAFNFPQTVRAADVNGDGRADVVVGNAASGAVSVLLQQADGTLAPNLLVHVSFSTQPKPQSVALGDIDGDGIGDIVASSDAVRQAGAVVLLRHRSSAGPPATSQEFVRSVSPPDRASGLALNTAPQVVFGVDVDPASLSASTVRLVDGRTGLAVPASLSFNGATRTLTLTPSAWLLESSPYRVVVSGVRDTGGNLQPWPFTWTFSTPRVRPDPTTELPPDPARQRPSPGTVEPPDGGPRSR